MPARREAAIIPGMPHFPGRRGTLSPYLGSPSTRSIPPAAAVLLAIFALAAGVPRAAGLEPRSYAWLMSHATLVVAGTVTNVSGGLFGDGRRAGIRVDGLIKGRWNRRELEIAWNDKDFEETGYKRDARVIVFAVMGKDSVLSQPAAGISCWPVERVEFNGKTARAVEYAYPLDLITQIPATAIKATESVEKSMNFRVAKRNQWVLIDNLLPPVRPLVIVVPKPPGKRPPRHAAKSAKPGKPAAAK
jgi:hypothetical protein